MFYFDQTRCIGCKACVAACIAWHENEDAESARRRVITREYGDVPPFVDVLYWSVSCCHCEEPACLNICPNGCFERDADTGTIQFTKTGECAGCGMCAAACPWGAIRLKNRKPVKCEGCAGRLAEGLKPACAAGCTVRALQYREKYGSIETDDFVTENMLSVKPRLGVKRRSVMIKEALIKLS